MNANKWELTRNHILAAPVPADTRTYTAIPHSVFLEEVTAKIIDKGYTITSERYLAKQRYQVVIGAFNITSPTSIIDVISPSIYFVNSYNKQRSAVLRAGATVLVCKNGMIASRPKSQFVQAHKGNALNQLRSQIDVIVNSVEEEFERLAKNVTEMQAIELDKKVRAQLIGDMFINEALINSEQLSILKRELEKSTHFAGNTLWDFYNNCTESFKTSHPDYFDKQHIKFHSYIGSKFDLTGNNHLYGDSIIQDIPFLEVN